MEIAISTKNLTKYYGKNRGVIDLTFQVYKGEVFGFLGPNGAGKTTTTRLLLDFMHPSSGSAEIFSLDSHQKSTQIKEFIGYLPGELHLYDSMTGNDFLAFMASFRKGVDWTFVFNLASRLKADLKIQIRKLSHGNKQKIGLITAFMHKPKILILDEPTMGLDPLMQQEFYKLVNEVCDQGTTFFVSSHNLPEVERICDRVGIIREGRLVVVEDIANLRKRALRPLEVHFAKPIESKDFEKIAGVKDISIQNSILRCTVVGSLDSFIKQLAKYEVVNLISAEPNLEEIFLAFYKQEEKV
ncbi:MAG TPA: ABC transporter ATP-binding protein [Candidatus Nanoarchaeia archaeon]|nr:vitamin B12 import ATP-binding protein BtuD [uncultured archaeon]